MLPLVNIVILFEHAVSKPPRQPSYFSGWWESLPLIRKDSEIPMLMCPDMSCHGTVGLGMACLGVMGLEVFGLIRL